MARLTTYQQDGDVKGTDKVLGSDTGGATKNYSLSSIATFFANSNAITIDGQLAYQLTTDVAARTSGEFWVNNGNSAPSLENISEFTISKKQKEEDLDVSGMLNDIAATKISLVEVGNPNVRGEYTVTSKYDYEDDSNFLTVMVSAVNTSGSTTDGAYYIFTEISGTDGDKKYTHEQSSASSTWTINHNLNKKPAVSVVDSLENVVLCEVEYTSLNQVVLTFDSPYSGKAYFN